MVAADSFHGEDLPVAEPPCRLANRLVADTLIFTGGNQAIIRSTVRAGCWLGMITAVERIGGRWLHPFGGVVLAEAEKQVYSGIPLKVSRVAERRHATAPSPSANRAGLTRDPD